MATRTEILLLDDIDGSTADGTVQFGLDGQPYEIDLNPQHADELRDALAKYIGVARKVSAAPSRNGKSARVRSASSPSADRRRLVRAWAKANPKALAAIGIQPISDRGRIAGPIFTLYDNAQGAK